MQIGNPLPKRGHDKVRGWVCAQYRTVGGKRYGPYWFRFYYEGGRLRKRYVRVCELEETRRQCEEWRARRDHSRAIRKRLKEIDYQFKLCLRGFALATRLDREGYELSAADVDLLNEVERMQGCRA